MISRSCPWSIATSDPTQKHGNFGMHVWLLGQGRVARATDDEPRPYTASNAFTLRPRKEVSACFAPRGIRVQARAARVHLDEARQRRPTALDGDVPRLRRQKDIRRHVHAR